MCHCALALVTDFDCWKACDEDVTADRVVQQMRQNVALATKTIVALLDDLDRWEGVDFALVLFAREFRLKWVVEKCWLIGFFEIFKFFKKIVVLIVNVNPNVMKL